MDVLTVSVVIPAYRAAHTIGRAIDSVLAQTRSAYEIVVVDDGSPDDLGAAVARYGDRVRVLHKANGGAASARNYGINSCRGSVIAFLDADDYWEPAKLERQLSILDQHANVGLVASRFFAETPGQPRRPWSFPDDRFVNRGLTVSGAEAFALATMIWTSTVLVRRELLADSRFVPGLEPAEDRDLWVRLVLSGSVYLLADRLATYVIDDASLSTASVDRDCGNMLQVVRRHAGVLGPRGVRYWEADTYRRWAGNHLARGCPQGGLKPAWSRLRRQPLSPEGWWILGKCALASCLRG
jgi:glycosyltransferase involved in cell wall biosynthesis